MDKIFQFLADNQNLLVIGILFLFGLIEGLMGYYSKSNRTKDDLFIESFNMVFLFAITKPAIVGIVYYIFSFIFPNQNHLLSNLPLALSVLIFVLVDDFLQYWYHRSSHEYKWLWKWHRPHHAAREMGFLISYRESVYFYMLMPNIWWIGIYTFFGGGIAALAGIVLKQIIVISSHSLATWDSFFYKRKSLMPIMKVIEKIFITPAFHHAHHAVSIVDDIGHPNGNFGNMFSIWDQMFGSAKFTHKFPTEYGLQHDYKESWAAHTFYPLVTSDKPGSEISKAYTFNKTAIKEPSQIELKAGDYLYCQCGYSKNQPFCDGSHHGTKIHPLKFTIKKDGNYRLCNCKLTKRGPFCDNSHLK